jgi:DNA-binding transcriptional regulator PaaX
MAKKATIAEHIVNLLIKAQAVGETFFEFTYHPYRYIYKNLFDEIGVKESSVRSSLTRLEKKGFLERKTNNARETLFKLTDKGQLLWLKKKLKSHDMDALGDRFVLAVFDIPEKSRVVRNALRNNLKEFGFAPWQKSVWATNKDVFDLVKQYFDLVGLSDYVIILETNKSSR